MAYKDINLSRVHVSFSCFLPERNYFFALSEFSVSFRQKSYVCLDCFTRASIETGLGRCGQDLTYLRGSFGWVSHLNILTVVLIGNIFKHLQKIKSDL